MPDCQLKVAQGAQKTNSTHKYRWGLSIEAGLQVLCQKRTWHFKAYLLQHKSQPGKDSRHRSSTRAKKLKS